MSVNFTDIAPEIPSKFIIPHLNAVDTWSVACTSSPGYAIIQCAAGLPQREITLEGKLYTVTFDENDQSITLLLRQKKKVELLISIPLLMNNFVLAREAVKNGYFKKRSRVLEDNPNELQVLCRYANERRDTEVLLPLILFDVTAKHAREYDIAAALKKAVDHGATLVRIVLQHSKEEIEAEDLKGALILAIEERKSDVFESLLSHKSAKKLRGAERSDVLTAAILAKEQDRIQGLLSLPFDQPLEGYYLGDILEAAIVAENDALIRFVLIHPGVHEMRGHPLAKALTAAIRHKRSDLVEFLLSHPNYQEIGWPYLSGIIVAALRVRNPQLIEYLLSHRHAKKIGNLGLAKITLAAIKENQVQYAYKFLQFPNAIQLISEQLVELMIGSVQAYVISCVDTSNLLHMLLSHPNTNTIEIVDFCPLLEEAFLKPLSKEGEYADEDLQELLLDHPNTKIILGDGLLGELRQLFRNNDAAALHELIDSLEQDDTDEEGDEAFFL